MSFLAERTLRGAGRLFGKFKDGDDDAAGGGGGGRADPPK